MQRIQLVLAICALCLSAGAPAAAKHHHPAPASKPAAAAEPAHAPYPQVRLVTNQGEMVIELYPEKAPKTVENFLQYVASGYYKGTVFHRVIDKFLIQGGGYTATLEPKETLAPIPIESNNGLKNEPGMVAMARGDDPNSATSQFFINLGNNMHLNYYKPETYYYGYCVFGKVIKGMEVAKKIGAVSTEATGPFASDVPKEQIVIEEITPVEQQEHKATVQPTPQKDLQHG